MKILAQIKDHNSGTNVKKNGSVFYEKSIYEISKPQLKFETGF